MLFFISWRMSMQHFRQSKRTFILAAVWSAAWLGNLWRFPFQVYDNWGAVFLVVYFILLVIIGLWLLFGEVAYGQRAQRPAPQAFWQKNKWLSWIWRAWALTCLAIVTYYSSVIAWALDYLWYSWVGLVQGTLPWAENATGFFYESILQLSEAPDVVGKFSMPVLIWIIVTWVLIYLFTRKSATSVGKVVWITATLPFLFLLLLMIRAVTLPGAWLWFEFLTSVDWSRIWDTSVWLAAAGQIFFSLSIWFWMMLTYGAMKQEKSELMWSTFIVLIWDTLTSLLSAVLVFWTLWFMAASQGVGVTEVSSGWPGLAFVTVPEAIAQLPFAAPLFAVMFFATLFFLAIDSAMAMVESVVNPLRRYFTSWKIEHITLVICVVLWLVSLIFARQNGLYLLDVVDNYINKLAVIIIAIAEVFVFAWWWKELTTYMKERSDSWINSLLGSKYFLAVWVLTAVFLIYTLVTNIQGGILVYDEYSTSFLRNGLWVVIAIFIAAGVLSGMKISQDAE